MYRGFFVVIFLKRIITHSNYYQNLFSKVMNNKIGDGS